MTAVAVLPDVELPAPVQVRLSRANPVGSVPSVTVYVPG
jgi:hypothetical protein